MKPLEQLKSPFTKAAESPLGRTVKGSVITRIWDKVASDPINENQTSINRNYLNPLSRRLVSHLFAFKNSSLRSRQPCDWDAGT
jgi:hypothetical protein